LVPAPPTHWESAEFVWAAVVRRRAGANVRVSLSSAGYTKAIEQLGDDKTLDVRIGGIYALERIARDSPRDHRTVMEVLTAFIRDHSREPWPPPPEHLSPNDPYDPTIRPDIQAAVDVIRRRDSRRDQQPINFFQANLRRANLVGADLAGALLTGANLTSAIITEAKLTGASAVETDFRGANLSGTYFTGANLDGAKFGHAKLWGADLTDANLNAADFTNAMRLPQDPVPEGWQLEQLEPDLDFWVLNRADI
jgi:Pentapeptide repeats (8 copies)